MKAIVLGSNGYIGKHMARALSAQGYELTLVDVQKTNTLKFGAYSPMDLTEKDVVNAMDFDVDFVFFMAGLTGTFAAYEKFEQFIDVNEKGLLQVLNAMRKTNSRARIVFP